MKTTQQTGLEFHLFDVLKVTYERNTSRKEYQFNISIKHNIVIDKEDSASFQAFFYIDIKSSNIDEFLNIQMEAVGHFKIIGNFSKQIIDNYLNISSPSIVYPYLRAFLANFTMQTGINPINLPPVNFANQQVVLKDKKIKKSKKD